MNPATETAPTAGRTGVGQEGHGQTRDGGTAPKTVAQSADVGCATANADALREDIRRQAADLGFVNRPITRTNEDSPAPDLLLVKEAITIAVDVVPERTTIEHEFERIRSHLQSGLNRLAVVSGHAPRLKALATTVHAALTIEEALKVGYYTPEEFSDEIRRLANTPESTSPRKPRP